MTRSSTTASGAPVVPIKESRIETMTRSSTTAHGAPDTPIPTAPAPTAPGRLASIISALAWLAPTILALALTAARPAAAADPPIGGQGPISISADHLTADQNSRLVTFTGRVVARQDDLIITCDKMRVHYQPSGSPTRPVEELEAEALAEALEEEGAKAAAEPAETDQVPAEAIAGDPLGGGQEINRVDCEGSVRVQQKDKLAVGQKALYLARARPRRLILTGDARIWEGANSITGHQVVYYLDENRSQVESSNAGRVRAYYDQGAKRDGKKR